MCDVKPGPRCSNDTRDAAASASASYETAYPDGPPVDPITAAREAQAAHAESEAAWQAKAAQAKGYHRMVTEGTALRMDQALGAAQYNVREARRALHTYGRHSSHGTVLGQRLRDVEKAAAELKALGAAAPTAGVTEEEFFAAMKNGVVGGIPDRQELPEMEPAERPEGQTPEQSHLAMLISSQVQNLDRGLLSVDNRLRDARVGLRGEKQDHWHVGEGEVLGQVGQNVDEASARLDTLLQIAPVMGLDEKGVRHAYYTGLQRP